MSQQWASLCLPQWNMQPWQRSLTGPFPPSLTGTGKPKHNKDSSPVARHGGSTWVSLPQWKPVGQSLLTHRHGDCPRSNEVTSEPFGSSGFSTAYMALLNPETTDELNPTLHGKWKVHVFMHPRVSFGGNSFRHPLASCEPSRTP